MPGHANVSSLSETNVALSTGAASASEEVPASAFATTICHFAHHLCTKDDTTLTEMSRFRLEIVKDEDVARRMN